MRAHIDRANGEAKLVSEATGEVAAALTFRPRSATHVLPDDVIIAQLHRAHAYKLEWKAYEAMNRAKLALLSAAQSRRLYAKDERGAQADAGRADTLHHLIQTSRPAA